MTTTRHVLAIRNVGELAHRRGHARGYWCPVCNYVTTRPTQTGIVPVICPQCHDEVPMREVWQRAE